MSSSTQQYEIEIKSLLGTADKAQALKAKLQALDPQLQTVEKSKQLNHYFVFAQNADPASVMAKLFEEAAPHLATSDQEKLKQITEHGKKFSVRTRLLNDTVLLVVKAAIDETTSSNGISRMEFEAATPDLTLDQLDQLLLKVGFAYQAKWSREREAFAVKTKDGSGNITVSLDKNAGYGYLAEFEKIVPNPEEMTRAQQELRELMTTLEAQELAQDRLERMFAFYNANWAEYYGTDNVFTVE